MRHEKIFRLEDGGRLKISASLFESSNNFKYSFSVSKCQKGKRTWRNVVDVNGYEYRRLSMDDRKAFHKNESLKHASPSQINEVYDELWQMIKPEIIAESNSNE